MRKHRKGKNKKARRRKGQATKTGAAPISAHKMSTQIVKKLKSAMTNKDARPDLYLSDIAEIVDIATEPHQFERFVKECKINYKEGPYQFNNVPLVAYLYKKFEYEHLKKIFIKLISNQQLFQILLMNSITMESSSISTTCNCLQYFLESGSPENTIALIQLLRDLFNPQNSADLTRFYCNLLAKEYFDAAYFETIIPELIGNKILFDFVVELFFNNFVHKQQLKPYCEKVDYGRLLGLIASELRRKVENSTESSIARLDKKLQQLLQISQEDQQTIANLNFQINQYSSRNEKLTQEKTEMLSVHEKEAKAYEARFKLIESETREQAKQQYKTKITALQQEIQALQKKITEQELSIEQQLLRCKQVERTCELQQNTISSNDSEIKKLEKKLWQQASEQQDVSNNQITIDKLNERLVEKQILINQLNKKLKNITIKMKRLEQTIIDQANELAVFQQKDTHQKEELALSTDQQTKLERINKKLSEEITKLKTQLKQIQAKQQHQDEAYSALETQASIMAATINPVVPRIQLLQRAESLLFNPKLFTSKYDSTCFLLSTHPAYSQLHSLIREVQCLGINVSVKGLLIHNIQPCHDIDLIFHDPKNRVTLNELVLVLRKMTINSRKILQSVQPNVHSIEIQIPDDSGKMVNIDISFHQHALENVLMSTKSVLTAHGIRPLILVDSEIRTCNTIIFATQKERLEIVDAIRHNRLCLFDDYFKESICSHISSFKQNRLTLPVLKKLYCYLAKMFARHKNHTPRVWSAMMELWTICNRLDTPYPDAYFQNYLGHYMSMFMLHAQQTAQAKVASLSQFMNNIMSFSGDHRQSPRGVNEVAGSGLFLVDQQKPDSPPLTQQSEYHQHQTFSTLSSNMDTVCSAFQ